MVQKFIKYKISSNEGCIVILNEDELTHTIPSRMVTSFIRCGKLSSVVINIVGGGNHFTFNKMSDSDYQKVIKTYSKTITYSKEI